MAAEQVVKGYSVTVPAPDGGQKEIYRGASYRDAKTARLKDGSSSAWFKRVDLPAP
jgi:hypothetical protein